MDLRRLADRRTRSRSCPAGMSCRLARRPAALHDEGLCDLVDHPRLARTHLGKRRAGYAALCVGVDRPKPDEGIHHERPLDKSAGNARVDGILPRALTARLDPAVSPPPRHFAFRDGASPGAWPSNSSTAPQIRGLHAPAEPGRISNASSSRRRSCSPSQGDQWRAV